ncbi:AEC family transporter [Prosthecomicrobium pneumaticum]|uniref:Malonate transporter n=1 Tax=Prosthecomicrobium pneumaticum TaxID=81895 RepID=A0A7W9FJ22_9HYPH|nr:AEC family transporter [Prosthecomicrobium pneumaticum]MBB5751121.1 hypothetical protein [Prosthecomicrobium pneumaticum]
MNDILTMVLPFFGLIGLGWIAGRLVKLPIEGLAWLNIFVVYLALPALFFQLVAKTPVDQLAGGAFVASTTLSTLAAFAIAFSVGALLNGGRVREATIQGVGGAYANIGYMGPGLTLAALGPAATVPTALIFCFDNALLFTLVPLLMALGGTRETHPAALALTVVKRILLHPFIIATLAGILAAVAGFHPPQAIDRTLVFLSGAAAPCALFAMGVTMALRPVGRFPAELPLIVAIKLLVHPTLVYLLLGWVGDFDRVWVFTAVLMAALPPATNVFVLAQQYGVYVQRASATILVGTLVSVFTVTALLYAITNGLLPADLFP